jgi:membrane protease YdiL (CAAX protease family)
VKYLKVGVIGAGLNVLLSLTRSIADIGTSENSALITEFIQSSPKLLVAVFYCILIIAVPIIEEVIFRGGLWKLISRFGNEKIAAVLVALIFSFLHSWEAAFFLLPFSVYLSYLRYNHGNIWYGVIAHVCFNGTALVLLPRLF